LAPGGLCRARRKAHQQPGLLATKVPPRPRRGFTPHESNWRPHADHQTRSGEQGFDTVLAPPTTPWRVRRLVLPHGELVGWKTAQRVYIGSTLVGGLLFTCRVPHRSQPKSNHIVFTSCSCFPPSASGDGFFSRNTRNQMSFWHTPSLAEIKHKCVRKMPAVYQSCHILKSRQASSLYPLCQARKPSCCPYVPQVSPDTFPRLPPSRFPSWVCSFPFNLITTYVLY
jgi:hypothetical protein